MRLSMCVSLLVLLGHGGGGSHQFMCLGVFGQPLSCLHALVVHCQWVVLHSQVTGDPLQCTLQCAESTPVCVWVGVWCVCDGCGVCDACDACVWCMCMWCVCVWCVHSSLSEIICYLYAPVPKPTENMVTNHNIYVTKKHYVKCSYTD